MNASFAELKVLSKLLVIEIDIPYEVLPVDLIFLEKVEKFYICVGGTYEKDVKHVFQNTLCCMVDKSVVLEGVFHVLGKKTEVLYLRVKDLKNLQKELEREELLKVRDLELQSCDEMVSLGNTVGRQTTNVFQNLESLCLSDMRKLKSICSLSIGSGLINLKRLKVVKINKMARLKLEGMENLGEIWLTHNLRELTVINCHGLVKIFSSSITMGSVMLERLTIYGCKMMDAIFWNERGENEAASAVVAKIQFPHLKYLQLGTLPNLTHFCKSFEEVEFPQLEKAYLSALPKLDDLASKGHLFNKKEDELHLEKSSYSSHATPCR
ncbi:hypothetical protein LguiA_002529 [Lonicera macranthoides]